MACMFQILLEPIDCNKPRSFENVAPMQQKSCTKLDGKVSGWSSFTMFYYCTKVFVHFPHAQCFISEEATPILNGSLSVLKPSARDTGDDNNLSELNMTSRWYRLFCSDPIVWYTLQRTNGIRYPFPKALLKMILLFLRWEILVSWWVNFERLEMGCIDSGIWMKYDQTVQVDCFCIPDSTGSYCPTMQQGSLVNLYVSLVGTLTLIQPKITLQKTNMAMQNRHV